MCTLKHFDHTGLLFVCVRLAGNGGTSSLIKIQMILFSEENGALTHGMCRNFPLI
jgi:hypothetical protein